MRAARSTRPSSSRSGVTWKSRAQDHRQCRACSRTAYRPAPLWARLFAVIDTLDAMTTDRPYPNALSFDDAKMEIRRLSGSQLDSVAVQAFLAEEPTLREMVARKCGDAPPISLPG